MRRLIDRAEAALDRRLNVASSAPIALALSGGGDSMALLHLAQGWARRRGRRLLALTVDHRLNPDSGAWTAFAGAAAKRIGAEWRALPWLGDKPQTGLPAAARAARHSLLSQAAREAGAATILFGHTADDVAENALMRAEGSPTLGWLREWSPSPAWPDGRDIFCLRPLLDVRRAALRDWLRAERRDWLEDPANDNPKFARARARLALGSPAFDAAVAIQPVDEGGSTLAALARQVQVQAFGELSIRRAALQLLDDPTVGRFLAMAAICASGRPAPPRGDALQRLRDRLERETDFTVSLAGARIAAMGPLLSFAREAGELMRSDAQPVTLRAGETAVWDGRFEIRADADLTVAAVAGSAARLSKSDRGRLLRAPASIRPSLPALFQAQQVRLPRPFGDGPAIARPLCAPRLSAACGLIGHESDISPTTMAQGGRSSYVEDLALALAP